LPIKLLGGQIGGRRASLCVIGAGLLADDDLQQRALGGAIQLGLQCGIQGGDHIQAAAGNPVGAQKIAQLLFGVLHKA